MITVYTINGSRTCERANALAVAAELAGYDAGRLEFYVRPNCLGGGVTDFIVTKCDQGFIGRVA